MKSFWFNETVAEEDSRFGEVGIERENSGDWGQQVGNASVGF